MDVVWGSKTAVAVIYNGLEGGNDKESDDKGSKKEKAKFNSIQWCM